jgi:hypothetical protein
VKLPPRSPNWNAHAERFGRTIKESCLERMILFGESAVVQQPTETLPPMHFASGARMPRQISALSKPSWLPSLGAP